MSRIILIVGPTCVGKTSASIALAHALDAEIINADSTQVYKEPLIATAKATLEEQDGVKHHMMDIISLNEEFTLFDYQKKAREVLDNLIKQNKNVIIVGGSGLYVKALLYDYKLSEEEKTDIDLSNYTNEELYSKAKEIDPNMDIHINNRHRLERFIKSYEISGNIIKKTDEINKKVYDFETIGLTAPREEIYRRCDLRVDAMVENGLLEEAKNLYDKKYKKFTSIIGYRELSEYFKGNISLDEALNEMKKNTRHYAKRQETFYAHQFNDIKWFETNYDNFAKTINEIKDYLRI